MVDARTADPLPRFGDRRRTRVGLLGGSFNPAHAGHLHSAKVALRRLALDQVWLLVSPGNPLKDAAGMATLAARLASAHTIADGRRILATGIERWFPTPYTLQTIAALRRRFPCVTFVWLMGADNLVQFPRWRGWLGIARAVPFAVLPRPTYNHAALAGQAARRLAPARRLARSASALAWHAAPISGIQPWVFLDARQDARSATAVRLAAPICLAHPGEAPSPESPPHPPPAPTPSARSRPRK